jgi:PLD-like domain
MSQLVWSPVYKILEQRIQDGDDIVLLIVPFVKLDALKKLQKAQANKQALKLVCRWDPEDLISGVSDLEVFTYLNENGCELYLNGNIHLKLYVFASNIAFSTSGNLTLRGLGYSADSNVEVGNMVSLGLEDWEKIYQIIAASRQVDHEMYGRFRNYVESRPDLGALKAIPNLLGEPKTFTRSSLPAVETPSKLQEYYFHPTSASRTPEEIRCLTHDLIMFGIPSGLDEPQFEEQLSVAFKKKAFVSAFVGFLSRRGSLSFGEATQWIYLKCEDVPLPYRWELKKNTRILYGWLTHFFREITWDVPGGHSQVIYWNK